MELSKRLQAVVSLADGQGTVCDVGCDHGYISIYLIENGIFEKSIAMDINKGPLESAKVNIAKEKLEAHIETRLSDGLDRLNVGEADCIIIAGMGGPLMINILKKNMKKVMAARELVLQPQSDIPSVRRFLREIGLVIDKEDMEYEDEKFYPMFHVKVCDNAMGENFVDGKMSDTDVYGSLLRDDGSGENNLYDTYGEHLLKSQNENLKRFLNKERNIYESILNKLNGSESAHDRIKEIEGILNLNEKALAFYK